jgi:hypothetical protein
MQIDGSPASMMLPTTAEMQPECGMPWTQLGLVGLLGRLQVSTCRRSKVPKAVLASTLQVPRAVEVSKAASVQGATTDSKKSTKGAR